MVSKFEVEVEVRKEVVDVVVSWMVGYSHRLGKKREGVEGTNEMTEEEGGRGERR